jgi:hypothetical protein
MLKKKPENNIELIDLTEFNKKTEKRENILNKLPKEVVNIIGSFLDIKEHYKISYFNKQIITLFKPSFDELAAYQAMIDGRVDIFIKFLKERPELLIKTPDKNLVIKSSLNGLRFHAEELLKMVIDTNQVNILNAIEKALPDMLKKVAEKNGDNAIDAVKDFENKRIKLCKEYKNSEPEKKNKEFIKKYLEELKILIETIAKSEDNGTQVMQNFRKKWLSDNKTIYLDKVDIKAWLLASYQAFNNYFNTFKDWDQRDAYCIKIIGFFQLPQFRETAEVFCQGLYDVVEENKPIGKIAKSLKLVNDSDISYYSAGGDFFIGMVGARRLLPLPWRGLAVDAAARLLENYLIQKQSSLTELLTRFCQETTYQKMILNLN